MKLKLYQILRDDEAKKEGYLRVIDESGEDYPYPQSYFILVQLPRGAQEALQFAGKTTFIVKHFANKSQLLTFLVARHFNGNRRN